MPEISVPCASCGRVGLSASKITLTSCKSTGKLEYYFSCPVCHTITVSEASEHGRAVLLGAGVIEVTTEPPVYERISDAEPVSVDEVIDLHEQLRVVSDERIRLELGLL